MNPNKSQNALTFHLVGGPLNGEVFLAHLHDLPKDLKSIRLWKNPKRNRIEIAPHGGPLSHEYVPRDEKSINTARTGVSRLFHIHHEVGFESKVGSLLCDFDVTNVDIIWRIKTTVSKDLLSGLYHHGWWYDVSRRGIVLRAATEDAPGLRYATEVLKLQVEKL